MSELEGNASVGGDQVATPETVAAPAPVQASPLEPKPESYLSRMEQAVLAADAAADGGTTLEEEAAQVISEVTDAPVSGEDAAEPTPVEPDSQIPDGETPPAEGDDAAPKPVIDYSQLPDNMRAELRRANLAPEVKEALAQAWYERKAYHDVGFSVDQARDLKSVGLTPEIAGERLRLHPTLEDAATDVSLANLARTLVSDFATNPSSMLDGLASNAPDAFPGFADAVAERLQTQAPATYGKLVSKAMLRALTILDNEVRTASPEDFETLEKIAFVRDKFFPPSEGDQARDPNAFNPNDPIHRKYAEQQQQQQQQRAMLGNQFVQATEAYAGQAVYAEVMKSVDRALPAGTDASVRQRAADEIMDAVAGDFYGNRGIMSSLANEIQRADMSQAALNNIVHKAVSKALPLIAVHARPTLAFWAKNARVQDKPPAPAVRAQGVAQVGSRTVANAPSASKIAGSTPAVNAPATPPGDFIAQGRKRGWDTGKILSEWLTGQR